MKHKEGYEKSLSAEHSQMEETRGQALHPLQAPHSPSTLMGSLTQKLSKPSFECLKRPRCIIMIEQIIDY